MADHARRAYLQAWQQYQQDKNLHGLIGGGVRMYATAPRYAELAGKCRNTVKRPQSGRGSKRSTRSGCRLAELMSSTKPPDRQIWQLNSAGQQPTLRERSWP
jgi:hypothetical protein